VLWVHAWLAVPLAWAVAVAALWEVRVPWAWLCRLLGNRCFYSRVCLRSSLSSLRFNSSSTTSNLPSEALEVWEQSEGDRGGEAAAETEAATLLEVGMVELDDAVVVSCNLSLHTLAVAKPSRINGSQDRLRYSIRNKSFAQARDPLLHVSVARPPSFVYRPSARIFR